MDKCPNCDKKISQKAGLGIFGSDNRFLSKEIIEIINKSLPEEEKKDVFCLECVNPSLVYGGVESRYYGWEEKNIPQS